MRSWTEVSADKNFTTLSSDERLAARDAYFEQAVLPNLAEGMDAEAVRTQFDSDTDNSVGRDVVSDIKNWYGSGSNQLLTAAGFGLKALADTKATKGIIETAAAMASPVQMARLGLSALGGKEAGQAVMEAGQTGSKYFKDQLSTRAKTASEKKFLTLEDDAAWKDPYAIGGMIVESLPGMLLPMGASAGVVRGVMAKAAGDAVKSATARGVAKEAALAEGRAAATSAATTAAAKKAAVAVGSVGEGAVTGGQTGSDTYAKIMNAEQTPEAVLQENPIYRDLLAQGATPAEARERVAMEAGKLAGGVAGVGGAVVGRIGAKFEADILTEGAKKGAARTATEGVVREGAEETLQSGIENTAANAAVKTYANRDQAITEGLGEAMVGGLVVGSAMGGGLGGAAAAGDDIGRRLTPKAPGDAAPEAGSAPPVAPADSDAAVPGINPADTARQSAFDQAMSGTIPTEAALQAQADVLAAKVQEFAAQAEEARSMGDAELAAQLDAEAAASDEALGQTEATIQREHRGLAGVVNRNIVRPEQEAAAAIAAETAAQIAVPQEGQLVATPEVAPVVADTYQESNTGIVASDNMAQATGAISPDSAIQEPAIADAAQPTPEGAAQDATESNTITASAPQAFDPSRPIADIGAANRQHLMKRSGYLRGAIQATKDEDLRASLKTELKAINAEVNGRPSSVSASPLSETQANLPVMAGTQAAPEAEAAPAPDSTEIPESKPGATLIQRSDGTPWADAEKARQSIARRGLTESHAVVRSGGGFALAMASDVMPVEHRATIDRRIEAAPTANEQRHEQAAGRRIDTRAEPTNARGAYKEALSEQMRREAEESPSFAALPVETRRQIIDEQLSSRLKGGDTPIDPTTGLIHGKQVIDASRLKDGEVDGTMQEAILQAAISHVKQGGEAHVFEFDYGNLGGMNQWAGQAGGDKGMAAKSKIVKDVLGRHGVDGDVSRYGGDEGFVVARGPAAAVNAAREEAKAVIEAWAKKTTPRDLNPGYEADINNDSSMSAEDKAEALRFYDTPMSELPKKPVKVDWKDIESRGARRPVGAPDIQTTYPKGRVTLHFGGLIPVNPDSTPSQLHKTADASLANAKNQNAKGEKDGTIDNEGTAVGQGNDPRYVGPGARPRAPDSRGPTQGNGSEGTGRAVDSGLEGRAGQAGDQGRQVDPEQEAANRREELREASSKRMRAANADRNKVRPTDELKTAIAKLGGLNRAGAKAQGIDPAYFKERAGALWVFPATAGVSFDQMAERLSELGYPVLDANGRYSANKLLDLVDDSLRGNGVYTAAGNEAVAQAKDIQRALDENDSAALPPSEAGDEFTQAESVVALTFREVTRAGFDPQIVGRLVTEDAGYAEINALFNGLINGDSDYVRQYEDAKRADAKDAEDLARRSGNYQEADRAEDDIPFGEGAGQDTGELTEEEISLAFSGTPVDQILAQRQPAAPDDFSLSAQSPEDLAAKDARENDQKAAREAERKREIENSRDSFTLSTTPGTALSAPRARNEQADVEQAARPSGGLLDEPVRTRGDAASAIGDFGERLEGARKFLPPSMRESVSDEDIASLPLSKIWPADAHESIENPYHAAFVYSARAEIPAKPRTGYKVARWVEKVKGFRQLVTTLEAVTPERFEEKAREMGFGALQGDFLPKVRLLSQLPRDTWARVESAREWPNAIGLKDGESIPSPTSIVVIDGNRHQFFGDGRIGATELARIKELLGGEKTVASTETKKQFEVRAPRSGGFAFINRKGDGEYRHLKIFTGTDAVKQARAFIESHADDLVAEWEKVKARDNVKEADVRNTENRGREAKDWRGGKDATEAGFSEKFGFRGVQFGEWVGQGRGGKERQGLLNEAFDALMDLSDILGIPSKAISLNGSLGLSFGARGSGKASAHFEPSNLVINLTKTKGAGALAHEWFHALDNYFARARGGEVTARDQDAYRKNNYITYKPERMLLSTKGYGEKTAAEVARMRELNPTAGAYKAENWIPSPNHKDGVRTEVEAVFAKLVEALNASPMAKRAGLLDKKYDGYWSRIIERGARSFENYVVSKLAQRGQTNDFLANIKGWKQWHESGKSNERYPYLFPAEEAPISEAFDELFQTIKVKEEDGKAMLYSRYGNDWYYSPLSRAVEGIKQETAPASQWQAMIAKLPGVKTDELEATGLTDWLALQTGKVTKAQILGFLDANGQPGQGQSKATVESLITPIIAKWKNGPRVVVVQSTSELPGDSVSHDIKGAYSYAGTVYLVADNLPTEQRAMEVLAHEAVGHAAMEEMLGPELMAELAKNIAAWEKNGSKIFVPLGKEVDKRQPGLSAERRAKEIVALMAERGMHKQGNIWKRVVGAIRAFLRSRGFSGKWLDAMNDADVFAMLSTAERYLKDGRQSGKRKAQAARTLSRSWSNDGNYHKENRRLREEDKTAWSKAATVMRKHLFSGGLLPDGVFDEKIQRDNAFSAIEFDVKHLTGRLTSVIQKDYGEDLGKLLEADKAKIAAAMAGRVDPTIPLETRSVLIAMRKYIDALSGEYTGYLADRVAARLETDSGYDPGSDADARLIQTITGNMGTYVHRSYRAFDDANWFKNIPDGVIDAARQYLIGRHREDGMSAADAGRRAEVAIHEIVKSGTAYESMDAFVAEGKLGAKDLSTLIKRKEIAPEIRALLGEYTDPRLNFAKSATKMSRLIWNQRFLDRVREIGVGTFLFNADTKPANATVQIAGDASEVYAPLNGMWATPEVAQAFKDALGKEQMSDLMRHIVGFNAAVKYGKTILSPTTAMRNIQSALFFPIANGHFQMKYMSKAIVAFQEQVIGGTRAQGLAYMRRMKELGVTYDTPNMDELVKWTQESKHFMLNEDAGSFRKGLNTLNERVQGFYRFGDDFWKIIGFENEKAVFIKAGFSVADAEKKAAERIRNTYPTYSMIGSGAKWLSRFPLVGTFVSFPAEIIRTTGHMFKYMAQDLASDNKQLRIMGLRRALGMAVVSGGFYALSAITRSAFDMDEDDEEAIRVMAPPWQKNATYLYWGRDDAGNMVYTDLSFLDPYGYWKRPLTAMMRNQPWDEALASGLKDMLSPFLGVDITTGAILAVISNKKESGGVVYDDTADALTQTAQATKFLAKGLAPGFIGSAERLLAAKKGEKKSSGQAYSMKDEMLSLVGWRNSTVDPKQAVRYRAMEYLDDNRKASAALNRVLKQQNTVSDDEITKAVKGSIEAKRRIYKDMASVVWAAKKSGMDMDDAKDALRNGGVGETASEAIAYGDTIEVEVSFISRDKAIKTAEDAGDFARADEIARRYDVAEQAMFDLQAVAEGAREVPSADQGP